MSEFIGRKQELDNLAALIEKNSASMVVLKGRRRIGKSRLVQEFSRFFDNAYIFMGLAPDPKMTAKMQLEEFSRRISQQFQTARAKYEDWSDAFDAVGERVQKGRVLLFFDEISWMAHKSPDFLSKLKNFWDLQLKNNPKLIFVVCGSASSWIEKNILSSSGFVGRVSYKLDLQELPLADCVRFWPKGVSDYEKFKILSVTGGVPKYLEELAPKKSSEENIRRLCFEPGGFLVEEFERIFADIFLRQSGFYKKIIRALSDGSKDLKEICHLVQASSHGRIVEYLKELELAGFVRKDLTWNIRNGQFSHLSRYRLADNYLRFYLKYIEKNMAKITNRQFAFQSLSALPGWNGIMGLQFENLVVNHAEKLFKALNVFPQDVVCANPFFQNKTTRQKGCQIDYLIQTNYSTLYVCEIKFSRQALGMNILHQVQQKIDRLSFPKHFSCRPVLIHVNGVSEELEECQQYIELVDAKFLLE